MKKKILQTIKHRDLTVHAWSEVLSKSKLKMLIFSFIIRAGEEMDEKQMRDKKGDQAIHSGEAIAWDYLNLTLEADE